MDDENAPIEHKFIRDGTLLDFEIVETKIEPTFGNEDFSVRIVMKTEDDILESCALGFMYVLGLLSFKDGRPRGASGNWFEDGDDWTAADMLRRLEYRRGSLHMYADYVRGRCLKTTIEIRPDGRMIVQTVNRGQAATRWVDRLQGKKFLAAV